MTIEELVLSRESLHAIRDMPYDGVSVFPIPFKLAPYNSQILRILVDNNREIRFLYFVNVRHPELGEIWREHIGFKISSILLCAEAFSHTVLLFCLTVKIIEDIGRIGHHHIGSVLAHKRKHV